jgi:phage terminase large subunit-like protein
MPNNPQTPPRIEPRLRPNWIASLPKPRRDAWVDALEDDQARIYRRLFWLRAHDYQREPDGDWTAWLLLGGRGSGKTRAGAEWVMEKIALDGARRVALIGTTLADVEEVMIGGPSGLRRAAFDKTEALRFYKSARKIVWPNGAEAFAFSAEDPDSLRGHAFDLAWSDEFAKWRYAQETFDNLQFALREGPRPRQLITTTPRNRPELRALLAMPGVAITRARSIDNKDNLSPAFFDAVVARYQGTRLGRQELDGELLKDVAGALWSRDLIEKTRVRIAPDLTRIVIAVDPPVTAGPRADSCGIVAAGLGTDGACYVLEDRSVQGVSPEAWAARALALYRFLKADCLVVETNQGGDLVRSVMAQIDPGVPVRAVHATRGKRTRAEPVAMLYEQGRVKHVGAFPELEDEMTSYGGREFSGRSPDRLDALVWAVTELMLRREGAVRVRGM